MLISLPARTRSLIVVLFAVALGIAGYLVLSRLHAATPTASLEAESGTLSGPAVRGSDGSASAGAYIKFGTATNANVLCGWEPTPPQYKHVVWIWFENKDIDKVTAAAPYFDSLAKDCGSSTSIMDNATTTALPSEPQYAAATSGSNCNIGITSNSGSGTGCITTDAAGTTNTRLTTQSIFGLIKAGGGTWKSYQESMPSNCSLSNAAPYAYKHNPAAFYTKLSDCGTNDVGMPAITCPTTGQALCSAPTGAFANDIRAGTLPTFAFVTPNLNNDMHDGTIPQGDNWLQTYIKLLTAGPNYKAGDTAIFIMWDEGSSNSGSTAVIPSVVVAPSTKPGTVSTTTSNNIGILRTTQQILGYLPYLGCALGTPPGGSGSCNPGSNVSLKADFNL